MDIANKLTHLIYYNEQPFTSTLTKQRSIDVLSEVRFRKQTSICIKVLHKTQHSVFSFRGGATV